MSQSLSSPAGTTTNPTVPDLSDAPDRADASPATAGRTSPHPDVGAPPAAGSRLLALIVLCASMLMVILDGTIVTVALPTIQDDLGFSTSGLAWVVNAYLVAFGGLLLLAGRVGDLVGRRRVFVAGLVLFTVASLLCGLATGAGMLIAARFVQGVGGALSSSVVLGMIVVAFPEPREQARAIGVFSFVGAAGASIGLLAGGLLVETLTWHWIFFVNVPIGAVAVVLSLRVLPAERGLGLRAGADAPGAALVTAGLMLGVYTIVGTADAGWASARTIGLGALALALLAAFAARQATAAHPLLPPRLFSSRPLTVANIVQTLMAGGLFAFQFVLALFLQRVLGYGPAETGLAFLPIAATIGAFSLGLSGRLAHRFGAGLVLLPGLVLLGLGLWLLSRLAPDAAYATDVLPVAVVLGCGGGLTLPALTQLSMTGVPPNDAGLASGLANTTLQVGGALGLAVLTTLAAWRTGNAADGGAGPAEALTAGYHLTWIGGAILMVAGLLLAVAFLRPNGAAGSRVP
ncbi:MULTISPECIES: MFS transporter [unclassified Parafrankia]|uniref:MFS transporter n=1 Tax=Parafrankia TaxID=2994362 RepID=UPI000DA4702E|nr:MULTISPECIES: MFS transporter [unclassified Parafrankia]CAI7976986.1 Drug resistance transporter, EmrB/QacA subfamily [Frankia sp. Hr75.2]SQD98536.1 Drug resistance transporter, EmrB/QacA subfamily [Parafrankia sp. Ea1.12]